MPNYTDLLERLHGPDGRAEPLCGEAADAIGILQKELMAAENKVNTALLLLRFARSQMNDMNLPLIAAIDNLLHATTGKANT